MSKLGEVAIATKNLCDAIDANREAYYTAQVAQKEADKLALAGAYATKTSDRQSASAAASDARKAAIAAELALKEAKLAELLGVEGDPAGNGSIWAMIQMAAETDEDTRAYHATTASDVETARVAYITSVGTIGDFVL
jgi:hypothetical protein